MKDKIIIAACALLAAAGVFFFNSGLGNLSLAPSGGAGPLSMLYPYDGTLFPADLRAPEFRWSGRQPDSGEWEVKVSFSASSRTLSAVAMDTAWTPSAAEWDEIRRLATEKQAFFQVAPKGVEAAPARVSFSVSRDPAGAPLFYRAVPSGKDFPQEQDYVKIKWRLAWLSSYEPPATVMSGQAACFNCHAISPDGSVIGFDYNTDSVDKSSYLFFRNPGRSVTVTPEMTFNWNGYKPGAQRSLLQANGSAISPDGKVIAASGKGLTLLHMRCTDMRQYTFPILGVLQYRTISDPALKVLPGADDEKFLYTPASWSPDGKYIYLFGGPIPEQLLEMGRQKLAGTYKEDWRKLGWRELDKLYPFRYNLYRIPFNGGRGGKLEPLPGAHDNGFSQYYPRVSPDGKWVAFNRSANGSMLIREDSDLYIMPAAGGEPRRLACNGPGADSWHSWSPNGRWLAYASKSHSDITDIMLTHISPAGESSTPVILTQLRDKSGLSLNLPEFFNIKPGVLQELLPRLPPPTDY